VDILPLVFGVYFLFLLTAEMASIPLSVLGVKITSLEQSRQEIVGAVDFLITGF